MLDFGLLVSCFICYACVYRLPNLYLTFRNSEQVSCCSGNQNGLCVLSMLTGTLGVVDVSDKTTVSILALQSLLQLNVQL